MDRGKAFVQVLSCVLSRLVSANDSAEGDSPVVTKFHALRAPGISILDYCLRINKYASCSPECFVLALVYIDRLIQRNNLLLTSLNVHRIIITAVMLAAKFFDDQYFNNAYYAKVGGVPTNEVNALELEFLFSINFGLQVPTDVYEKYYSELANHMGVGVPAEFMAANTCECARFAPTISYSEEEIRNTGMRTLDDMAAESLAAFAASGGSGGSGSVNPLVEGISSMSVDDSALPLAVAVASGSGGSGARVAPSAGGGMDVDTDAVIRSSASSGWRERYGVACRQQRGAGSSACDESYQNTTTAAVGMAGWGSRLPCICRDRGGSDGSNNSTGREYEAHARTPHACGANGSSGSASGGTPTSTTRVYWSRELGTAASPRLLRHVESSNADTQ